MDIVNKCKLCRGPAKVWGYADINKTCNNHIGFPMLGTPVRYDHCVNCGLIFTNYFDEWAPEDFQKQIYNQFYHMVDPDYEEVRPRGNAEFLHNMIQDTSKFILDYGGGQGKTAQYLRDKGYPATSWDPFGSPTRPDLKADVVTCIEVFEHVTEPYKVFLDCLSFVKPGGKLIFTTLINNQLANHEMHWYISPRNGHLLIHSYQSLEFMAIQAGVKLEHINNSLHVVTT